MLIKTKVEIPEKGWAESIMNTLIWGQFPPRTVNNSRSIARGVLEKFKKQPSEVNAQKLEATIEGVSTDVYEVLDDRPKQEEI